MRVPAVVSLCALACLVVPPVPAAPSADDARLLGRWKVIWETEEGQREYYFQFHADGDEVGGAFISPRSGEYPVKSASVSGDGVKIALVREYSGVPVQLDVTGEFDGGRRIHGTVSARDEEMGEVSMERMPDPVGEWKARSHTPDGSVREAVLRVERAAKGYSGTFVRGGGVTKATSVGWIADHLVIALQLPVGDREVAFTIDAEFADRNSLKGRWTAGNEQASGDWDAVRESRTPLYDPVGRWRAVSRATRGGGSKESALEIVADGGGYRAIYSGERGKTEYRRVACDGEEVRLELEVDVEGAPVTFVVRAEFTGANSLRGRWRVKDYAEYGGEWSATREEKKAP